MQVSGVEDDSRALNIVIHKPSTNPHAKPMPILQANFIFADHIRCIIAKQRLAKGRIQARRMKMQRIAGEKNLNRKQKCIKVSLNENTKGHKKLLFSKKCLVFLCLHAIIKTFFSNCVKLRNTEILQHRWGCRDVNTVQNMCCSQMFWSQSAGPQGSALLAKVNPWTNSCYTCCCS